MNPSPGPLPQAESTRSGGFDVVLFGAVLVLAAFGLVMV